MIQINERRFGPALLLIVSLATTSAFAQSAPFANTLAPGPVTSTSAVLNGFATPNGLPAIAWFEWGTRGSFGQRTSATEVGNGNSVVRARAEIDALAAGGTYDFRVAVSNSAGVAYGATQRFATGRKVFVWGQNYQSSGQTNFPAGLSNVVAIAANNESSLALSADGTIRGWGDNFYGQSSVPPGLQNVAAVACGAHHSVALRTDGTVFVWGQSGSGITNVPAGLSDVVAVTGGGAHSLALRADGVVVAWGYNSSGQATVPGGLNNVVAIAAGSLHSLAVRANGTVAAWGDNFRGQRIVPSGLNDAVAVAAGYGHSLALRRNGRVVGWGFNEVGQASPPSSLSNVIAIAAGYAFSAALKSDGTIVTWGANPAGTNAPAPAIDCAALAAGWYSVVELGNRAPVAFGQTVSGPANHDVAISLTGSDPNGDGLSFRISSLPTAGGLYQYVGGARGPAIIDPGTPVSDASGRVLFAPAPNAYGNPHSSFGFVASDGEMSSLPATVSIAMIGSPYAATQPPAWIRSTEATLAGMVTPNGFPTTAWFEWGPNYAFVTSPTNVGGGSGVVRVTQRIEGLAARGHYAYRLAVSNVAGVVYGAEQRFSTGDKITVWGSNDSGQTNVPQGLNDIVALDGGSQHSIGLKADGMVVVWGSEEYGKTNVPGDLGDVLSVAAGGHHNLALKADGTVAAWGAGHNGETNVPPDLTNAVAVAAGWSHSAALRADGTVAAWGRTSFGETNVPVALSNVTAIAAGGSHGLALRADGTVATWGNNSYAQRNVPAGLSNVIQVAAGAYHSVALKQDGTVVSWGNNSRAPGLSNVVAIAVGDAHHLALQRDGTVVAWGDGSQGQTNVPAGLGIVPVIAAGGSHSMALGNLTPQAQSQAVSGAANHDVHITLSATDVNGETLVLRITSLPAAGALFQFTGAPVTSVDTVVDDPLGRVIFRPAPDAFGSPYANFGFAANDGDVDSTSATATVDILGALHATTQRPWVTSSNGAGLNGMVLPNGFPTTAWFEWSGDAVSGQTPPVSAGSGGMVVRVSETLSGLFPENTYRYRLVASNANGIVYGATQVFSTGKKLAAWGANSFGEGRAPRPLIDVTAVAAGWVHSVALRANGTVVAWGNNYNRQTNLPAGLNNVVALSADSHHTLALKADGTAVVWGSYYNYGFPQIPSNWSNIVAIASGSDHDLGLRADGTVVAYGAYGYNQVVVPVGLSNVVAIAAGGNRSFALRTDGTVAAWGDAYNGWLSPPPGLSNVVALATSGSHSLALRKDGTVVAWGDNSRGQTNVPAGLSNVVAIAARFGHNLALKSDGTVIGWGDNFTPPGVAAGPRGVVAIAEGGAHSLAAGANIAPEATPQTAFGQFNRDLVITLSATDVNGDPLGYRITTLPAAGRLYQYTVGGRGSTISAGAAVTDALGRVIFVPDANQFGRPYTMFNFAANDGETDSLPALVQIVVEGPTFAFTHAAGPIAATGAKLNGVARAGHLPTTVWFEWGASRSYRQVTSPQSLAAGNTLAWLATEISGLTANAVYHCRLVASNAGGVAYGPDRVFTTGRKPSVWGYPNSGENRVPDGLTNVVAIAGGSEHLLALNNDTTVAGWGWNAYGQTSLPPGMSNVVAVAAGVDFSLALKDDGTVAAWGKSDNRQTAVPPDLTGVKRIAAGRLHSLALKNDGRVVAWGWNQYGQTNVPASLSNVVAIAAGLYHNLALKADGRVVAWGGNPGGYGQTNVPGNLTDVVSIACDVSLSMALRADGSLVLWGAPTNVATDWTNVVDMTGILALKHDGTVSASVDDNFGRDNVPARLTNVATIVNGYRYSAAIGNLPPVPKPQSVAGAANHDLVIQLTGTDPQEDALTFRIASLPGKGSLYQYTAGTRGAGISVADTAIADPQGRVIFAPAPDGFGAAYTSFTFLANDGEMDSEQTAVTVSIAGTAYAATQPAGPVGPASAVLNGMALANGFPTTAWFEWGTNSAFGQTSPPVAVGAGARVVRVTAPLDGLASNAVFHYRIVVSNAVNVAYGGTHLFTTGRRIAAWGGNEYGQTNVAMNLKGVVAVAADFGTSYAIRSDGTVTAWGYQLTNGLPPGLSNVVAIDEGMALKSDGTLATWGWNAYGETNIPPGLDDVIAIASGSSRRLALRSNGTVVAWGYDPFVPPGLHNIVSIASGSSHRLALKVDGTVIAWGNNANGQTNVPTDLSNVVALAAGDYSSLALKADGTVRAWGLDPVVPNNVSNVIAIAAGQYHKLAVQANGNLLVWGQNKPAWLSNAVGIAAGSFHSIVLRNNRGPSANSRSVSSVANYDLVIDLSGSDPDGDALTYRISARPAAGQLYQYTNSSRGAPITSDNTWVTGSRVIFAPGTNEFGNNYAGFSFTASDGEAESAPASVTISISGNTYAATLAASSVTTSAARLNGMAVASGLPTLAWFEWGGTNAPYSQATIPISVVGGANVVHLAAPLNGLSPGAEYRFRLVASNSARIAIGAEQRFKTGGKIATWGQSIYNLTIPPPGLANAVAVAGGGTHSLALLTDGTVKAWGGGDPYYGAAQTNVPPGLSDVVAVAAGTYHSVALRSNGTVRAWGGYLYYLGAETNVPANLSNVIAITASDGYSLALRNDGTIVAWGRNGSSVPPGLSNMVAIAAGGGHNLALRIDGTVFAWGNNSVGQATVPPGLSNVTAIAAGQSHSMALRANGTVATWGFTSGEANMPTNLSNVVSIAAGHNHRLALRSDGTVVGWGNNIYGQLSIPANLAGVVQLAGGAGHTLALDGNVPPSALSRQVVGYPNHDVIIPLAGVDANGDPLTLHVNPPTRGTAYQYESGVRGAPIVVPGLVTDPLGRIIFAPEPNQFGSPNPTFTYYANDGEASSPHATVTISVILPSAPRVNIGDSGWTTNGAFELNFTGQSNATYSVYASTNLVHWEKLGFAAPLTPSLFRFTDPSAGNWPQRFYRAGAP